MPDHYRRSEDPTGPHPHISMNAQDGHVAAIITLAGKRFVVQVESTDEGWNVYWNAPDGIACHDNIYAVTA